MQGRAIGHAAALMCALVWGITFVSTKVLLRTFSPYEILLVRFVIGYVMLWIMYPHTLRLKKPAHELYYMAAGFLGLALYGIFENTALTMTMAANVSILVSVAPFFTAILAHFFLGDERLRLNFIIGFVLAIFGVSLVCFNGSAVLKMNPVGDLLSVLCALVWGIYSIIIRKSSAEGYATLGATRRIFFYGILSMIILQPFLKMNIDMAEIFRPLHLMNYLFLGVFACAICYSAWSFAVERLGAVISSNYIYVIPVITVLASAVVLKERISLAAGAGMLLTIAGLAISSK